MNMTKTMVAMAAALAVTVVQAGDSAPFLLDTADGTRIAQEVETIAYSTAWNNGDTVRVAADGVTLKEAVAPASGDVAWNAANADIGCHALTHTSGGETLTARFAVLGDDVEVHGGTITRNEVWSTNKVHLVAAPIVLGDNNFENFYELEIQPGAIVKFMPGTGLSIESNAYCRASGAIFTHVNDDTIGGDTLMDGDETVPVMNEYDVPNMLVWDDEIEFRYFPDPKVTLSGTISENEMWRGHNIYCVTGNLTVASGATLTILPGAIVKFASGLSLTINSGAILNAIGTRAQPIVFTSIKDDEHGGDTNGDGDKTRAQGGDWRYIYVSGTANMKYCTVMHGAPNNETGILETSGSGSLNMDCCIVAHALYDGLWNWGGTISVKNTVISDTGWATAPYRGSKNEYINCIFYGNNVGVCYWSHWSGNPVYRNCIFTECGNGWCELNSDSYGDPPSSVGVYNCLFWNPAGLGAQSCGLVGSNGNIWGDPKFFNAENSDFRIQKGSACINAGDVANAPESDYYGQPRDDGAPDIGIYEFTSGMSMNDLAAVAISSTGGSSSSTGGSPVQVGGENAQAARSTIGDTITISWRTEGEKGCWRPMTSLSMS